MDLIKELKKHGINAELQKESIKFILDNKSIELKINKLENLFLETLINQIKFQIK